MAIATQFGDSSYLLAIATQFGDSSYLLALAIQFGDSLYFLAIAYSYGKVGTKPMLAAAYDYIQIASASGLLSALFGMEFRENARFSGFSGGFYPTFTDSVCIKDSVRIDHACGSGGMFVQTGDFVNQALMWASLQWRKTAWTSMSA